MTVSALTAADEPAGVFTHVNNANVVLDRLRITGGRRGVLIEKTTDQPDHAGVDDPGCLRRRVADDGTDVGAARPGRDATPGRPCGSSGARTASPPTASRSPAGRTGWSPRPDTARVVLQDLRADGVTGTRCPVGEPGRQDLGGAITGGATGIDVAAATSISGTSIGLADQGIRTESTGLVHADDVDVDAVSVGIDTGDGSPFLLTRSQVHALEAVRGTLDRAGDERPLPAAAEPARRHRHPAGPAGGVASGDRGPAGAPLRRGHPADPAGPAGRLRCRQRSASASGPPALPDAPATRPDVTDHARPGGPVASDEVRAEDQPRTEAGRASSSSNGPTTAVTWRLREQLAGQRRDLLAGDRGDPLEALARSCAGDRGPPRSGRCGSSATGCPRCPAPGRRAATRGPHQLGRRSARARRRRASTPRTTVATSPRRSGAAAGVDGEAAGVRVARRRGVHRVRQPALLADLLEQPRAGAAAERRAEHRQRGAARVVPRTRRARRS